jgi:hypothetical protein
MGVCEKAAVASNFGRPAVLRRFFVREGRRIGRIAETCREFSRGRRYEPVNRPKNGEATVSGDVIASLLPLRGNA